jgi:hypothetical protein
MDTTDYISIPFPKSLYDMIIIRSGGKLDPVQLAADQVEGFIERNSKEDGFWTDAGLEAFAEEERIRNAGKGGHDLTSGHLWKPVFMVNGTRLRMSYKGTSYYAEVRGDKIQGDDRKFDSVSQWVRHVAGGTSRNAWLDVWIRRPGRDTDYRSADDLRKEAVADV